MIHCKDCKWWDKDGIDLEDRGICHRHAPGPASREQYTFAPTGADDWCGEGESKTPNLYEQEKLRVEEHYDWGWIGYSLPLKVARLCRRLTRLHYELEREWSTEKNRLLEWWEQRLCRLIPKILRQYYGFSEVEPGQLHYEHGECYWQAFVGDWWKEEKDDDES